VAAIHAAVIVQLVDHDVAQVFEIPRPAGMVRQDSGVHHVGIGEHHVGPLPDGLAGVLGRIAIVGEGADFRTHLLHCAVKFVELVFGQRLGGKQVHGARAGIAQQQIQHRQVCSRASCRWRSG